MTETWPSLLAALAVLAVAITTGCLLAHLAEKINHR